MTVIKDELIRRILNSITIVEGDKVQIKGGNILEFQRDLSLLLSELMSDNNFQERLNRIRYFFSDINDGISFGTDFISILKELKRNNESSFALFKDRFDNKLNDIKSKIEVQKFELFYPINISTNEKINPFKYRDIEIKILDYSEIMDRLETKDLSAKFRSEKFTKSKYKYIHISIWGRNIIYAYEIATKHVSLILGLIANSQVYGSSNITIIGSRKPLTKLKLSYVFVFKGDTFLNYYYFEDKSGEIELSELRKETIDEINKFINQMQNADRNVENIVFRAINCYYLGLTEKRINYSFLNFWTALEILCLKSKGIGEYEVIRRLKSILITLSPLDEHKIDRLHSLRNNLVHSADYDKINQYDRDLLKNGVELMLDLFVFHLSNYNFSEINSIFYFLQKNDADLINDKKIIDFVIKLRRQN